MTRIYASLLPATLKYRSHIRITARQFDLRLHEVLVRTRTQSDASCLQDLEAYGERTF
jgi:hypothetical protein